MQIIHKINEFLYTLFPQLENANEKEIFNAIQKYYTYGPFVPKIIINNNMVTIDTKTIHTQGGDYNKTVALCEKGKFGEAKIILEKLIQKNPSNSEFHRILGQIEAADIKQAAFEIAMLGTQGIDPNKKDYIISSINNKRFSGNQVLAFYYVSWALAMPEQVQHLGLDFGKEYELAKKTQQ